MFFGMLTIDNDGFSMVLGLSNHWFQWFSMVKDHWSNDGMVSMDRTGLIENNNINNYIVTFEKRVMVTAFAILAMFFSIVWFTFAYFTSNFE